MEIRPNPDGHELVRGLNGIETDTIGEVLNISMGAAATAVSILLNRQVSITTPSVQVVHSSDFEFKELEPALGVEIKYIQGLYGSNHMIMSVRDVRAIVQLLLGEDFSDASYDADNALDEIHVSALGEVMNQMMGASCTALASFLDREINISPPVPFEISSISEKLLWGSQQDFVVAVGFRLTIEGLIDSEFYTVMPVPFAKELVNSAMGISGQELSQDDMEVLQVTGHTQVPPPVIGEDFKMPAKAASNKVPEEAPAHAPEQAQKPAAETAQKPAVAQKQSPMPAPKPAPAAARPAPAPMQEPAYTAPVVQPAQMPNPAAMASPAPVAMPGYAPHAMPGYMPQSMPAQMPMAEPAPAAQRSMPVGGHAPERGNPRQNVVVKPLQFGSLDAGDTFAEELDVVNLGLVMGVDLNVTVEIGRTRKQVKEILALRQGSIVELDKQAGAPVDIMVNGKLIARGDVVVIDDNFGVRVTEIVSNTAQK